MTCILVYQTYRSVYVFLHIILSMYTYVYVLYNVYREHVNKHVNFMMVHAACMYMHAYMHACTLYGVKSSYGP